MHNVQPWLRLGLLFGITPVMPDFPFSFIRDLNATCEGCQYSIPPDEDDRGVAWQACLP
jgi:hypothetical protein